jgi:hypothetical protein
MINTIRDRNYGRLRQLPHIDQLKVRRALEMHQAGTDSLGYAAEKVGLSKRDLIREAHTRGIEPPFDPRKATPDYKENVQISFFEFSGDTLEVDNKSLGAWDTTLLPTGWYSLRLWLREVNSQFLACDVYVFVQK